MSRVVVLDDLLDRPGASHRRSPRLAMSDRAGRGVTEQVGRYARSVNEIAVELGCDWHTVNDTVIAYGTALVDDTRAVRDGRGARTRRGAVRPDRHLAPPGVLHPDRRRGPGQLLDVVPGRSSVEPMVWLVKQGKPWRDQVRFATLDLSGPYRQVFTVMVPDAVQVADPFHVVKLANTKLDECRRRVQNETVGHRGRKADPLYRCRRLLTKAERAPRRTRDGTSSWGSRMPAIPRATWPPSGRPRRPSVNSTPTAIPTSPSSG